ncbi:hypothetical protein PHMEG_0006388 [Phytophthora megakarya]|uniref:Uncharacterized protein n=1 Tax=Phytophthora megakarya TaxID=4795 RepID=A0A225WNX3_9STRA|nr:hypothetical protein PHMEG_0006388 [Phytophthora megakarya]
MEQQLHFIIFMQAPDSDESKLKFYSKSQVLKPFLRTSYTTCRWRYSDFTHQAAPCTKRDLRALCTTTQTYATTAEDYKDCTLLDFLWYLLGRSSDIIGLTKNQVAVYPVVHHFQADEIRCNPWSIFVLRPCQFLIMFTTFSRYRPNYADSA